MLAKTLVTAAINGDMTAMKEIGDRLDGKPKQAVEVDSTVEHRYVARIPEPSATTDEWSDKHAPTQH